MFSDTFFAPTANVDPSAQLAPGVKVYHGAVIEAHVVLGTDVDIGAGTRIMANSYLEQDVIVGPDVNIFNGALIKAGAIICQNEIDRTNLSTNARQLEQCVTVGPGVKLHDEVELGYGAIIPTQRTITMVGNFGDKNRVVTIYGSDEGPRFCVGCQMGIDIETFETRVACSTGTERPSANTYSPYLTIFNQIGAVVQHAYDMEATLVQELKDQRTELGLWKI